MLGERGTCAHSQRGSISTSPHCAAPLSALGQDDSLRKLGRRLWLWLWLRPVEVVEAGDEEDEEDEDALWVLGWGVRGKLEEQEEGERALAQDFLLALWPSGKRVGTAMEDMAWLGEKHGRRTMRL